MSTSLDAADIDAFCIWLNLNERGGWVRAFRSLQELGGGALAGMDGDDLVAIFTNLGPLAAPDAADPAAVAAADAATDQLVAMLRGMSF